MASPGVPAGDVGDCVPGLVVGVGQGLVGKGLVGQGTSGEALVGWALVGCGLVGCGLVGCGLVDGVTVETTAAVAVDPGRAVAAAVADGAADSTR